jgi:hypothetical protein
LYSTTSKIFKTHTFTAIFSLVKETDKSCSMEQSFWCIMQNQKANTNTREAENTEAYDVKYFSHTLVIVGPALNLCSLLVSNVQMLDHYVNHEGIH